MATSSESNHSAGSPAVKMMTTDSDREREPLLVLLPPSSPSPSPSQSHCPFQQLDDDHSDLPQQNIGEEDDTTKLTLRKRFRNYFDLLFDVFTPTPSKLRILTLKLQKQGITGPPPSWLVGNFLQIKKMYSEKRSAEAQNLKLDAKNSQLDHNWFGKNYLHIEQWRREYGSVFLYSTGNTLVLCITDIEMIKEISSCKSFNLGSPSQLSKEFKCLFGNGILASNGKIWAHQRKIFASEFYHDKIKELVNLMVDSVASVTSRWETQIDHEGGIADIKIDDDLRTLAANIISRACFGSDYLKGEKIFLKLRTLPYVLLGGVPTIPTLANPKYGRKVQKLEKEIDLMILDAVEQRTKSSCEKDMLQSMLQVFRRDINVNSSDKSNHKRFIIDSCKDIYFHGSGCTENLASWALVLLATHVDWQERARAEVIKTCRDGIPDSDMLGNMKTLTMVIQETLRLYPAIDFVMRGILQDMKFKDILIPKGVNIRIPISVLHLSYELWGSDAHEFNPERFSNGILEACKTPLAYIPFGIGNRMCVAEAFVMTELKIVLCLILSKFSFILSPAYNHLPTVRMAIEPAEGVRLLMKKI